MKNIKELRDDLLKKYSEFNPQDEKAITILSTSTACASAIIRSAKTELDYKKYKKDNSEIEFLKTNNP